MDRATLDKVTAWAEGRLASGEEPPWTYFKLEKLAELTRELAHGFDSVAVYDPSTEKVSAPGRVGPQPTAPGPGAEIVQIGIARSRREEPDPAHLPT